MLNVGLTGGIAAGKSAVAKRLVELGAVLIDADAIARAVLEPGTPGLASVVEAFGAGILADDGALDRPALGALVFADEQARAKLNSIVHPLVRAEAARLRTEALEADPAAVIVQDIPLLVETGQGRDFDLVLVVSAPLHERLHRMARDRGMSEAGARARIAAQATDEQRAAVADAVIANHGTRTDLAATVDRIWAELVEPRRAAQATGDPGSAETPDGDLPR
ncbi:dephospho-CoA kinase [Paeniglutamicibacter cryotolerans]|uniref:Dephospho-CoA kinase n=1 Tax=Paeniglutamicibacter cryotolerans TaxID=670079 RepID=A0A839QMM2_9MICC|nr:dephospho-CoA kinase [Paeniglutamicibacter cryotolerans]MBB2996833.1 dephospho-CoA kinase [Paeniglutamicibacter cryotolerans]